MYAKKILHEEALVAKELDDKCLALGSLDKKDPPENGEKDIVYPSYDEDPAKAARGSSKARYRGNFENGQWHGKGLLINEDGDVYDGEFKYDLKHGRGSYATSDGTVFTGTWHEGTPVGEAHINFRNGESYQGQVSRGGAMDGKGGYRWPNGSRYDGEWAQGLMHGKGRFEYANGDVYEGPFAEDKRHGNGTITESGKQYDALFQKGRLIAYTKPLNGLKGASSLLVVNEVVCARDVEQAQRNSDMERALREVYIEGDGASAVPLLEKVESLNLNRRLL